MAQWQPQSIILTANGCISHVQLLSERISSDLQNWLILWGQIKTDNYINYVINIRDKTGNNRYIVQLSRPKSLGSN